MAPTNRWLAQRNKSCTGGWSTKPMNGGNRR
jgi:hypothetical protein